MTSSQETLSNLTAYQRLKELVVDDEERMRFANFAAVMNLKKIATYHGLDWENTPILTDRIVPHTFNYFELLTHLSEFGEYSRRGGPEPQLLECLLPQYEMYKNVNIQQEVHV